MNRIRVLGIVLAIFVLCFVSTWAFADGEWETSGDNIYNTNSGSVGIGIANPFGKVDITDGDGSQRLIFHVNKKFEGTWPPVDDYKTITLQSSGSCGGNIAFATGNTEFMRLTSSGQFGIGTKDPFGRLTVVLDNVYNQFSLVTRGYYSSAWARGADIQFFDSNGSRHRGLMYGLWGCGGIHYGAYFTAIQDNSAPWVEAQLFLNKNGNVGVGTNMPTHKLEVIGTIAAREVKVTTAISANEYKVNDAQWSDFVFEDSYKLPSLDHVESYIKENKHLPDVPSAEQIAEDGLSMAEMMAKQMQKIEELTLYMIELKKQNETLAEISTELVKEKERSTQEIMELKAQIEAIAKNK